MKKNILIISNDKLNIQGDKISADYNDVINIIESLSKKNHLDFFHYLVSSDNYYYL